MKNLRRTLKLSHLLAGWQQEDPILAVGGAQISVLHEIAVQFLHLSLVLNWYKTAVKGNVLEGVVSQAFEISEGSSNENYEIMRTMKLNVPYSAMDVLGKDCGRLRLINQTFSNKQKVEKG